jgi:hypothetical protein
MAPQLFHLIGSRSNVSELIQMTPNMAAFYSFHSSAYPSPAPSTTPISSSWGPAEALSELTRLGCTLATKAWVDNHWGLILWKLAGMVCLDPDAEADPHRRRWTWTHVMKQLLYRSVPFPLRFETYLTINTDTNVNCKVALGHRSG